MFSPSNLFRGIHMNGKVVAVVLAVIVVAAAVIGVVVKKKDLVLTGNARLTMAYNVEKTEAEDLSDAERQVLSYLGRRIGAVTGTEMTNDFSVASRIGASINYKDCHRASAYFSISNYSDNIIIGQHVAINTDVRFMLQYSYTFASRLIKSKKSK